MATQEELNKQRELERKIKQQIEQERAKQILREEEIRRIREKALNEQKQQDNRREGKPTGTRPEED